MECPSDFRDYKQEMGSSGLRDSQSSQMCFWSTSSGSLKTGKPSVKHVTLHTDSLIWSAPAGTSRGHTGARIKSLNLQRAQDTPLPAASGITSKDGVSVKCRKGFLKKILQTKRGFLLHTGVLEKDLVSSRGLGFLEGSICIWNWKEAIYGYSGGKQTNL